MRTLSMGVAVLAWSASAAAQDGGKLNWEGKKGDVPESMADAAREGFPMMLFFTSKG